MHIDKKRADCCGCSACASKCPRQAISMEPDELGFLHPVVNEDKCIHCGLCIKVCSFQKGRELHSAQTVYGARLKDKNALEKSRSGGAFWALGSSIIQDNGVVYGSALLDDFTVAHIRVSTLEDMERLRGSKYVQSRINDSYIEVLADLRAGLKVLFTGTPCQISGLYSFLGRYYENLFTMGLVCHGVPSPKVWSDYLDYVACKTSKTIDNVIFRDKSFGWHAHMETFVFSDGTRYTERIFRDLFFGHFILRDSCHNCPFASLKRVSDITVGDFWGWEKNHSEFADNKGVSLILVSTQKGKALFNTSEAMLEYVEVAPESCLQPQLMAPATRPVGKEAFRRAYVSEGFKYVIRRYGITGWRYWRTTGIIRCKIFCYNLYKRIFKNK